MTPNNPVVRVSNVMTSRVRTAEPTHKLSEILRMLMDERCHHIPILQNRKPVGMISSRDLVGLARKSDAGTRTSSLYDARSAGEIMSTDLQTVHMDDSVDIAIDRIGRGDIHALLVVDDDDQLAGIVTNRDLLQYLID